MIRDYKDWIANRTLELAEELYHADYDSLPTSIQYELYERASAEYSDRQASRIEALYEAELESRLMSEPLDEPLANFSDHDPNGPCGDG